MFDLSFTEMLLAGVVALVVLGPERLPRVVRMTGEWVGKVQRLATNLKAELASQADYAEIVKVKKEVESVAQDIRGEIKDFEQHLQDETQQIGQLVKPDVPAWDRLPEQRTPEDFGIVQPIVDEQGFPIEPVVEQNRESSFQAALSQPLSGIHTPSLHKQAMKRKRDMRPRHRPLPKLRSRK